MWNSQLVGNGRLSIVFGAILLSNLCKFELLPIDNFVSKAVRRLLLPNGSYLIENHSKRDIQIQADDFNLIRSTNVPLFKKFFFNVSHCWRQLSCHRLSVQSWS